MVGHDCDARRDQQQQQVSKPKVVQKWVPKQPQNTRVATTEHPVPKVLQQPKQTQQHEQSAPMKERAKSNPYSVVNTPIQPIVHQWKMVTRRNRGKRIIVPCDGSNEDFCLNENDEEQGDEEEHTTELNAGENPYLSLFMHAHGM